MKVSQTGETILGEYPDAEGGVANNAAGKNAFKQDARPYLNRVLRHLSWSGTVRFKPGGMAVSGDAILEATWPGGQQTVLLVLSAGGHSLGPVSPSGVNGYWRFEGADAHPLGWNAPGYRNRQWTVTPVAPICLACQAY